MFCMSTKPIILEGTLALVASCCSKLYKVHLKKKMMIDDDNDLIGVILSSDYEKTDCVEFERHI